jgi:hypothetical protein
MMTSLARIRPSLRRAAFVAALGALTVPATAGAAVHAEASAKKKKAKPPVVTSVSPMKVEIGQKLEIRGRYFLRGRNKNTVVFKRSGGKAVFVKADVGTTKLLRLTVPTKLEKQFATRGTTLLPTRFRIRVLAKKFGKKYTANSRSPIVSLRTPPAPPGFVESQPDGDCDGDGSKNRTDADDDNDGLTDAIEESLNLNPCTGDTDGDGLEDKFEFDCDRNGELNRDTDDDDDDLLKDGREDEIGTDSCLADTDGDGVSDGYEYQSARDLNDDEHQESNTILEYPGKRPYPNALDPSDAGIDHDGDVLTLGEEYSLWLYTIRNGHPRRGALSYSAGEQYTISTRTDGRRHPALAAAGYDRQDQFLTWARDNGYARVELQDVNGWWYGARTSFDIRDFDRTGGPASTAVSTTPGGNYRNSELHYYDQAEDGWLTDAERDEDADGLTNFDESHGCMMDHGYWASLYDKETPYPVKYGGTRLDDEDTDGDGVRDGADDQDHDDLPNLMECSRNAASGRTFDSHASPPPPVSTPRKGFVNPFSPCLPATGSRTCNRNPALDNVWAPFNSADKYYYVFN